MKLQSLFALSALSASTFAQQCTNGAVVYAVRGSDTTWNSLQNNPNYDQLSPGMVGTAQAVVNRAGDGSYYKAIAYPAINPSQQNLQSGDYARSVSIGINNLQTAINNYANKCPTGKIFVIGFSQGAQVVSGALAGCTQGYCNYGIVASASRVTGGLVWADPGFQNHVTPIDAKAGNASLNNAQGTVEPNAAQYQTLNSRFRQRFRSYCQSGDAFCNSGFGTSSRDEAIAIHRAEPETYQRPATNFLLSFF